MNGQHRGRSAWLRLPLLPEWLPDWMHHTFCRYCRGVAQDLDDDEQLRGGVYE